jgi:DNA helicase-2/ATP-dependent DNA helicase PcrA
MRLLALRLSGRPAEIEAVRQWYEPHLERIHEDAVARRADLMQLEQIAASYPSRQRFLTELTIDPPAAMTDEADTPLLDEDYLILSTIHSAKGQEWSSVFVLNVVDGCIPSDLAAGTTEEIEEERRSLYVATTRAKNHLDLLVPQPTGVNRPGASTELAGDNAWASEGPRKTSACLWQRENGPGDEPSDWN